MVSHCWHRSPSSARALSHRRQRTTKGPFPSFLLAACYSTRRPAIKSYTAASTVGAPMDQSLQVLWGDGDAFSIANRAGAEGASNPGPGVLPRRRSSSPPPLALERLAHEVGLRTISMAPGRASAGVVSGAGRAMLVLEDPPPGGEPLRLPLGQRWRSAPSWPRDRFAAALGKPPPARPQGRETGNILWNCAYGGGAAPASASRRGSARERQTLANHPATIAARWPDGAPNRPGA